MGGARGGTRALSGKVGGTRALSGKVGGARGGAAWSEMTNMFGSLCFVYNVMYCDPCTPAQGVK